MYKILLSLVTVGAVGALAFGATTAFFSDSETSTGNTFTAGSIDLKIDSNATYNDEAYPDGSWELKDLLQEKFFTFDDIKPGDKGENTISMHVVNNDAWACLTVNNLHNDGNGLTDPESEVDTTDGLDQGELAQNLNFFAWSDDGDNIWESGEPPLFSNTFGPASDVLNGRTYALADSTTGTGPILGGPLTDPTKTRYIGVEWCAGTMSVDLDANTVSCDGSGMGNVTQSDSLTADVSFYVEQARNNPNFSCAVEFGVGT